MIFSAGRFGNREEAYPNMVGKLKKRRLKRVKTISIGLITVAVLFLGPYDLLADIPVPAKGGTFPPITLTIPKDSGEMSYLGLSGTGSFMITKIRTKVLIIEIFSMYCPTCQTMAPGLNEMFQFIEGSPELRDRIKLIGIGAGNSPYEVEVYRKTHKTPFPLFPDRDFAIHKAIGEVRTPHFFAIKIRDDGTHEVVYSEPSGFKEPQSFLQLMIEASGLK